MRKSNRLFAATFALACTMAAGCGSSNDSRLGVGRSSTSTEGACVDAIGDTSGYDLLDASAVRNESGVVITVRMDRDLDPAAAALTSVGVELTDSNGTVLYGAFYTYTGGLLELLAWDYTDTTPIDGFDGAVMGTPLTDVGFVGQGGGEYLLEFPADQIDALPDDFQWRVTSMLAPGSEGDLDACPDQPSNDVNVFAEANGRWSASGSTPEDRRAALDPQVAWDEQSTQLLHQGSIVSPVVVIDDTPTVLAVTPAGTKLFTFERETWSAAATLGSERAGG